MTLAMKNIGTGLSKVIVAAGKEIAGRYRRHDAEVKGWATFIVPTAVAFSQSTPWVAVPVTIGSALAGRGVAIDESFAGSSLGVLMGGILLSLSGVINLGLDRGDNATPPDRVIKAINSVCWDFGKKFPVEYDGKTYTVTIEKITNSARGSAIAPATPAPQFIHSAFAVVTHSYNSFWTGKPEIANEKMETAIRPGVWDKAKDSAVIVGMPTTLNCQLNP